MSEVPLYIRPSLARNESLGRTLFFRTLITKAVVTEPPRWPDKRPLNPPDYGGHSARVGV